MRDEALNLFGEISMQNCFELIFQNLSFSFPNQKTLFDNLTLSLQSHKIGLVGKNGIGKSTLIKLLIGELQPNSGSIIRSGKLAYVPQNPIFPSNTTVADFLGYSEKISALNRIANGSVDEKDFEILNDDWEIKEKLQQQLNAFELNYLSYDNFLHSLSGGELTRLFLIKAFYSEADFIVLDEPTNHLDIQSRKLLFEWIKKWKKGLLVISHDRTLLNLMDEMIELTTLGINSYGGNFEDYQKQKYLEREAKQRQLDEAKKSFEKTEKSIQTSYEKHDQRAAKGIKQRRQGKIDKLSANSAQGRSERSQRRLVTQKEQMRLEAQEKLQDAKENIEIIDEIKVSLPETEVPAGKMILEIEALSFQYSEHSKFILNNFNLKIMGPERIAIIGPNGSGKTTLIKLILEELKPTKGRIDKGITYISYLDQNASLLKPNLTLLENFMDLNPEAKENDAYRALASFLFKNEMALKLAKELSGGEKLRALLACTLLSKHPPQLLILDEPTNHLDLSSVQKIESALKNYQGAMLVISHDEIFLENIGVERIVSVNELN